MSRAQSRLALLGTPVPGSPDETERSGLRDAIEHYRCITERPAPAPRAPFVRADPSHS
jgi:hypothetical protein